MLKDSNAASSTHDLTNVSVLYREPKLLKAEPIEKLPELDEVSVLYREPKLLKEPIPNAIGAPRHSFSALP